MAAHQAHPAPYPVSETPWVVTLSETTVNPAARLVEAVQREDITREDIARTVSSMNPTLHALAQTFVDQSNGRQTIHKFCSIVRAQDPATLERTMHVLCNQVVSTTLVGQAQAAMQEQRERQRQWRQRADFDAHE